jgi:hypothetical protein
MGGVTVDPAAQRKARRQRVLLLVVVNALVLATALVASVDLRRLRTPGGTALRWVQAAVFGDCADYLDFSVPDSSAHDQRSRSELCEDLRLAARDAQRDQLRIGLHQGPVTRSGDEATATVTLTRDGEPTALSVHLVRRSGRWWVLRDAATCSSVGCA